MEPSNDNRVVNDETQTHAPASGVGGVGGVVIDISARKAKARRIVRRASERVRDAAVKSWLFCDERGTFEKLALELCARPNLCVVPSDPATPPLDDAEEAIAIAVALAALETRIRNLVSPQR